MTTTFAAQANIDPQADPVAQGSVTPKAEPQADPQVALIVGERAFATMDDVKTKIVNADAHITNIESENATMRAELDAVKAELATATSLDQVLHSKDTRETSLSQDNLSTLVREQVGSLKAEELSNSNRESCITKAQSVYGDDFIVKMQTMATELGLTMDDVDSMAGTNPRLFTKTFLPSTPLVKPLASHHASTIRTSSLQDTPVSIEYKPVLSLTSKERTAQFVRQLEALQQ